MFLVLDGIDGAGKGRQRLEILDFLKQNQPSLDFKGEEFPVHNEFYENVIHPALQEKTKLNKSSWVLSYLLDKTMHAETINPYVGNSNNLFIADGYFTTTIAYQSYLTKQVELKKLIEYSKDFEIPTPDLAIFIDVDPEVAFRRKEVEEGHEEGLDMFEKSIQKQLELQKIFREMADEKIYCKWEKVDGNGSIIEVRDAIISILKNYNFIN